MPNLEYFRKILQKHYFYLKFFIKSYLTIIKKFAKNIEKRIVRKNIRKNYLTGNHSVHFFNFDKFAPNIWSHFSDRFRSPAPGSCQIFSPGQVIETPPVRPHPASDPRDPDADFELGLPRTFLEVSQSGFDPDSSDLGGCKRGLFPRALSGMSNNSIRVSGFVVE